MAAAERKSGLLLDLEMAEAILEPPTVENAAPTHTHDLGYTALVSANLPECAKVAVLIKPAVAGSSPFVLKGDESLRGARER